MPAAALSGLEAISLSIEVHITRGIKFFLVGMPDSAIRESKHRIYSALRASNYKWPGQRITINLAPANVKKEGSAYDLPIALAILHASKQQPMPKLPSVLCIGELSLTGELRTVRGIYTMVEWALQEGISAVVLPESDAYLAQFFPKLLFFPCKTISAAVNVVQQLEDLSPAQQKDLSRMAVIEALDNAILMAKKRVRTNAHLSDPSLLHQKGKCFTDVKGQQTLKRALFLSAAGGHHCYIQGPPGVGKTMLLRRMPGLLPALNFAERKALAPIRSASAHLDETPLLTGQRPFEFNGTSLTKLQLLGKPEYGPGALASAHLGFLVFEDFHATSTSIQYALHTPLDEAQSGGIPAMTTLLITANPCKCGNFGHPTKRCSCTASSLHAYTEKLCGPFKDRIDIHIMVTNPIEGTSGIRLSTVQMRERVATAREFQRQRWGGEILNAFADALPTDSRWGLTSQAKARLEDAATELGMSERAKRKLLGLARTIADLEAQTNIRAPHMEEALRYRPLG